MKSCRPKTPGGKAVMPEYLSLSLSAVTLQSRRPLSPPPPSHPHSFTLLSLFPSTSLTVSHFKTQCLIISAIAVGVLYWRPPEKRFDVYPSVSCLMWSISRSVHINSLDLEVCSTHSHTHGYCTNIYTCGFSLFTLDTSWVSVQVLFYFIFFHILKSWVVVRFFFWFFEV